MTRRSEKAGRPETGKLRLRRRDAENVLEAIRKGEVDGLVVSGPDGERVFTLQGAETPYRVLVEQMRDGAATIDERGLVLYCNRRFAEMLWAPLEDVIGNPLLQFVDPADRTALVRLLARGREAGGVSDETRLVTRQGGVLNVQLAVSPLPKGDSYGLSVLIATDITKRKVTEQMFHRRSEEAKRRGDQLRNLALELSETEERERRRLAQVLHDGLQQYLVAAQIEVGHARSKRASSHIQERLRRVEELLAEALEASRELTVDLCPPVLQHSGLVPALRWLARQMERAHGLKVEIAAMPGVVVGESIRFFLFNATRELLLNVVKHSGVKEAKACVSVLPDERLEVMVEDRGAGFDPVAQAKELETGFGLLSVRERLGLLGGSMEIVSSKGNGTIARLLAPSRFAFIEPVHERAPKRPRKEAGAAAGAAAGVAAGAAAGTAAGAATGAAAGAAAGAATGAAPVNGRHANTGETIRVLIVDDHSIVRQGLKALLALESDMEPVGEASNGAEAIAEIHRKRPDVVVMDTSMPVMNGIEATRVIHSEWPDLPVVGLSMYASADMLGAMQGAGAVAYITKDTAKETLCKAIRKAHDGRSPSAQQAQGADDASPREKPPATRPMRP